MPDSDPFLAEAQRRGVLTAAQADELLALLTTLGDVQVELTVDELAARKGFLTTAQAGEIRRALARQRIGRYEVLGRLGEGAAGVVWKALDTKLDRVVALKVLSQKAQSVPEFRERFLREARIAVTLNHVNIVRGLDYGETDGYHFFAMEFVEGESAEKRLSHLGRIPERDAVAMTLDVVRALQYVQKFHIVHRDIKPGNLMITSAGHVKLCDLGLAKPILTEKELASGDGSTAGTPYYMSPEQITDPDHVDWRSDVYSLGATLFHLLTGRPPFRPDAGGLLQQHLNAPPPNPRETALELSDGVASVVLRMLQKKPEDRYDVLEELTADLESVLAGRQPLHTVPPPPPETVTAERHARVAVARRITEKNLPREHFPWPLVAMFAMFCAAVVFGWFTLNSEPKPPAPPPREPVRTKPPIPAPPPVDPGTVGHPPVPAPEPPPSVSSAETKAAELLRTRLEAAQRLAADGHFDRARAALLPFPPELAATKSAAEAQNAWDRFDKIAHGRFLDYVKQANEYVKQRRMDEARDQIVEAAKMETSWAEMDAEAARRALAVTILEAESRRDEQAPAFALLYGRALLAAGRDGVAAARELVKNEEGLVDTWANEVADLRDDLRVLELNGVEPNPPLDDHNAAGARATLLARLARGEVESARREIEMVRRTGGDADAAAARVAHVQKALEERADERLAKAEIARRAGHFEAAFRLANEAHALLPGYGPAVVMSGRLYIETKDLDQALALLEPLAHRRDAPPAAHYWAGVALARKGDENLARAESELQQFVDGAPDADPLRPEAEALLRDVHGRRVAGDVSRWREAAKAAARKGNRLVAEGQWNRVLETLPDDPEALLRLGQIYATRGSPIPAYVVLNRLTKLSTADVEMKANAKSLLETLKKDRYSPDDGLRLASTGDRLFAHEHWSDAIAQYENALIPSPWLTATRVRLAQTYLARSRETGSSDDLHQAVTLADGLREQYPSDVFPLALRVEALLLQHDNEHALADATRAVVDIDAKSAAAQLAMGRALLAQEPVPPSAADAFQKSFALEASPEALLGLVAYYVRKGDEASARDVLRRVEEEFQVSGPAKSELAALRRRVSGDEPPK